MSTTTTRTCSFHISFVRLHVLLYEPAKLRNRSTHTHRHVCASVRTLRITRELTTMETIS